MSVINFIAMDEGLKYTCLHDSHLSLGAKMSPFAGYDMPIQYSGIIDEHNAVRKAVGVFDVSHMGEIFVSGADAERFVNHVFTNDVSTLDPGRAIYGMMLYPDAGTVDDLLVYRELGQGAPHYLLVVNASNIDKDYAWLVEHSGGYDVVIDNQSSRWGQIAVQGPLAEDTVARVLGIECCRSLQFYGFCDSVCPDGSRLIVSRTGYTGEDGFELYASTDNIVRMWDALIGAGVTPCGLGCRDTLRFEAGMPLYGDELTPDISPVMAGLSMFCALSKEGGFIGSDALAAQKADGVKAKLVGIEIGDRAIPRAGYDVLDSEGAVIGRVTTGYRSISLDKSICFALIDSRYASLGTPVQVQIRHKSFPGAVVKKRFYQTNYKK